MDNHIHVVLWVHRDIGKSILEVAHGFQQGMTHIAQDMGIWPKPQAGSQVCISDGACIDSSRLTSYVLGYREDSRSYQGWEEHQGSKGGQLR